MTKKPVAAGKSSLDLIDLPGFFAAVEIHPGAQVLDAACGAGLYSLEMAKVLDERGLIHAVDLWKEGIESLKDTIRDRNIANINPVLADISKHIPLDNESIDFCLMATVLHDLSTEEQAAALLETGRVLKPGGTLAVIEFKKIDTGPGPPVHIRISEQEAEDKIRKFGFRKTDHGEIGQYNYLMKFERST